MDAQEAPNAMTSTPTLDFQKVNEDGYTFTMTTTGKERGEYSCKHSSKRVDVSLKTFIRYFNGAIENNYQNANDGSWVSLAGQLIEMGLANTKVPTHAEGSIVLAPPGSGKSWFVAHEGKGQWADVDEFLGAYLKFHTEAWTKEKHTETAEKKHYLECDKYLRALRDEGVWIVGSLFWEYVPDAIVVLNEATHRKWVAKRDDLDWASASKVRRFLQKHGRERGVPVYRTWDALNEVYI